MFEVAERFLGDRISRDRTRSTAMCRAAHGVRLPVRLCRKCSSPASTVNSKSCISRNSCFKAAFARIELPLHVW